MNIHSLLLTFMEVNLETQTAQVGCNSRADIETQDVLDPGKLKVQLEALVELKINSLSASWLTV